MKTVRHHLIDEEIRDQSLADQAAVHVGKGRDDSLDLVIGDHALERLGVDLSDHETSRYTVFHSV